MNEKVKSLLFLKNQCLSCKKCKIGCNYVDGYLSNVFSNMCIKAKIIVIGQNPGHTEIEKKQPFVGPSGYFFDNAIKEVLDLDRSHFYISNIVRCYTQFNRSPTKEEIQNCRYFLDEEIKTINPDLIITLGNPSLLQITGIQGITKVHGKIIKSIRYNKPVLPLFHPSPLNTNKPDVKKMFFDDLIKVKDFL